MHSCFGYLVAPSYSVDHVAFKLLHQSVNHGKDILGIPFESEMPAQFRSSRSGVAVPPSTSSQRAFTSSDLIPSKGSVADMESQLPISGKPRKQPRARLKTGQPGLPQDIYMAKGGSGLGAKPEKPRRCDRCALLHRSCVRPLKRRETISPEDSIQYDDEENNGRNRNEVEWQGKCRRCVEDNKDCTTAPPQPRKQRAARKRTDDRALSSTIASDSGSVRHQTGALSATFPPEDDTAAIWGNIRPSSRENSLRRTQQAGSLRVTLIFDFKRYTRYLKLGYDVQFVFDMFDAFIEAFERCGRDPKGGLGTGEGLGLQMGRWGELKCALYCAAGSHISEHSSVLGCDPFQLQLQAMRNSPVSTIFSEHSPISPGIDGRVFSLPKEVNQDLTDLRVFGQAREPVVRSLWMTCARLFEDSGIMDLERSDIPATEEMVQLLDTLAKIIPYDQEKIIAHVHRIAVGQWRRAKASGGFKDYQTGMDCFENLVQDDVRRHMMVNELPCITDADILREFADPYINPRIFLTFDGPKSFPKPRNSYDHHQILWANGIAIQRLIANLGPTINSFPAPQGELILERMLTLFQEREAWRQTTYTVQQVDGRFVRMQEFGQEMPVITASEMTMVERSCFCFLRAIENRVRNSFRLDVNLNSTERRERMEILGRVWKATIEMVDQKILEINGTDPVKGEFNHALRARLRNFPALPEGYRHLGRYLYRARDPQDFERRKEGIDKIHVVLKKLSYNGAHFLRWLLDLEEGLRNSTSMVSGMMPNVIQVGHSLANLSTITSPANPKTSVQPVNLDVGIFQPDSTGDGRTSFLEDPPNSADFLLMKWDQSLGKPPTRSLAENVYGRPGFSEQLAREMVNNALRDISKGQFWS